MYSTISKRTAEAAERMALRAVSEIPEAHNRKREEAFEKAWKEVIELRKAEKDKYISDDKAVGREAIYYYTENVGSRNFPHYVFRVERTTVRENERRLNLLVIYR